MASRARLSYQQKGSAAQIAREKDPRCLDCGYSERVPGDAARAHHGGGADIVMRCVNCQSAFGMTLVLSPAGSKALGHALQDDSEVAREPLKITLSPVPLYVAARSLHKDPVSSQDAQH